MPVKEAYQMFVERTGLHIAASTFHKWVAAGKVPSIRYGACRYLKASDVELYIREGGV